MMMLKGLEEVKLEFDLGKEVKLRERKKERKKKYI